MYVNPSRLPPSLRVLSNYNVNRGLGQIATKMNGSAREAGGGTVSPIVTTVSPQKIRAMKFKMADTLQPLISTDQFASALASGLIPMEKVAATETPSRLFNWTMYRYKIDPAKRDLRYPSHQDYPAQITIPWTRAALTKLFTLYKHEDGGALEDVGDKINKILSHQVTTLKNPNRGAIFKLPAVAIAPTRDDDTWDSIKKMALIAGAAVGVAFLGNVIIAKIGAGLGQGAAAAAGTAGGEGAAVAAAGAATTATTALTVPVATTAGTAAAAGAGTVSGGLLAKVGASGAMTLLNTAKGTAEKILPYINNARTIQAIVNGEMPPPPISITDGSFVDWAVDIGKKELMEKLQRDLTRAEEAKLKAEVEALQREWAKYAPTTPNINPKLDPRLQKIQGERAVTADQTKKLLWIALPILAVVALGG